jgi:hypothetical protein
MGSSGAEPRWALHLSCNALAIHGTVDGRESVPPAGGATAAERFDRCRSHSMPGTCKRCRGGFTREKRTAGRCPICGAVFETAELIALCIGLTCTYLLTLVSPELWTFLSHGGAWTAPSDQLLLVRACAATAPMAGGLLVLSYRYSLWQGEALNAHPHLRLLWLPAAPGLLWAGLVLAVGVAYLAARRRLSPRASFAAFLRADSIPVSSTRPSR